MSGLSCKTNVSAMSDIVLTGVARPTSVGSPETIGANLGPHTHYEADFGIELEFGHHPLNPSGPLQRPFEGE